MTENLTEKGWVDLTISIPPELAAQNAAPDLKRFFDAMVYKLRRNAHKGKWEDVNLDDARKMLHNEVAEFDAAIHSGSTSEILMEAADVANQALIAANVALDMNNV